MNRRGYEMLHAVREAGGHHVYSLRCGAIGTVHGLFSLAKALGFNGTKQCFAKRLHKSPDSTLLELAAPSQVVNKPKPRDKSDVLAAIAALDARKRDAK